LREAGRNITLEAICEASRELDEQGKSLKPITILRNPERPSYFTDTAWLTESANKSAQGQTGTAKPKPNSEVRASYRGLRSPDLIEMVEDLKTQLTELKAQQEN